jgi:hypothetical protein
MNNAFEIRKSSQIAAPTDHPRFEKREEAEVYIKAHNLDDVEVCQVMNVGLF